MASATKPFQPWKKNLLNGFVAIGILVVLWISSPLFENHYEKLFIAGATVSIYCIWQFKQASVRSFGQRLERQSIKKLTSVLGSQNVRGNLPFPGHGDIDCVARINDKIFNIEIKAFGEFKKINRTHIHQALAASNYLNTKPVIWLPNCKNSQFGERNGVLLYACNVKQLVKKLR